MVVPGCRSLSSSSRAATAASISTPVGRWSRRSRNSHAARSTPRLGLGVVSTGGTSESARMFCWPPSPGRERCSSGLPFGSGRFPQPGAWIPARGRARFAADLLAETSTMQGAGSVEIVRVSSVPQRIRIQSLAHSSRSWRPRTHWRAPWPASLRSTPAERRYLAPSAPQFGEQESRPGQAGAEVAGPCRGRHRQAGDRSWPPRSSTAAQAEGLESHHGRGRVAWRPKKNVPRARPASAAGRAEISTRSVKLTPARPGPARPGRTCPRNAAGNRRQ